MWCVYWHNNSQGMRPLVTFTKPKYTCEDRVQPCAHNIKRPRTPKRASVRTPQFCSLFVYLATTLLQVARKV